LQILLPGILIAVPAFAILLGLVRLKGGWDDGAITAAFARTLAQSGRLALTPVSVSVEGMSSLAWLLLLTLPAFVTTNVWAIVAWMKICAGLAFLISLPLMLKLSRRLLGDPALAATATLLLALSVTPFKETLNGMEMNLLLLLSLALALVLTNPTKSGFSYASAIALSTLMLLTRFEAPFVLLSLYTSVWFADAQWGGRKARPQVVIAAVCDVLVFAVLELWRFRSFHLLMPNTVYAKRWTPYRPPFRLFNLLIDRGASLLEIPIVLGGAIAVVVVVVLLAPRSLTAPRRLRNVRPYPALLLPMSAASLLFSLALGQNWGHPGRMILGFLPFLSMLMIYVVDIVVRGSGLDRSRVLALVVLTQAVSWTYPVLHMVRKPDVVPVARYEGEGLLADHIRKTLGQDHLTALIPDVGGAALCCERLDIHDAALLTNPTLAQTGFSGLPEYFHQVRPEVVIISSPWSRFSNLYQDPVLATYGVVGDRGFRALVRPDAYARLAAIVGTTTPIHDSESCENLADSQEFDDIAYTFRHKDCVVLPGNNDAVSRAN
jgi:hypothetical protein